MTWDMTLQVILVVLLAGGAAVKAWDCYRSAGQMRLLVGSLAVALTSLALGQAISFPPITNLVDSSTTAGFGKLAYNAITIVGLSALQSFFYGVAEQPVSALQRRLLAIWTTGLGVICGLALLVASTPSEFRAHSLKSAYLAYPSVAGFYVVGGVYFTGVFVVSGRAVHDYARRSRGGVAAALHLIAAGMAALVVASFARVLRVLLVVVAERQLLGLNSATFYLNNIGYILVSVGLSVAGISQAFAAWRWWRAHRAQYASLGPLWRLLTETFPDMSLQTSTAGQPWLFVALPSRAQHQFQRRLIEIRDGLLRLQSDSSDPAVANARGTIRDAVAAVSAVDGRSEGAVPPWVAADADVDTLVAISERLRDRVTTRR